MEMTSPGYFRHELTLLYLKVGWSFLSESKKELDREFRSTSNEGRVFYGSDVKVFSVPGYMGD